MNSFYRDLLKSAWQISRKNPLLWILGLFVAFLGNGGELQTLFNYISRLRAETDLAVSHNLISSLTTIWNKIDPTFSGIALASLTLLVGLIVTIVFVWFIISSLGGLILGAKQAHEGQKNNYLVLLNSGNKKFWELFGLNIAAKIIIYAFLILILTPLISVAFSQGNMTFNYFVAFLAFLLFVPLSIIIALVTKYASAEVMLKSEKFWNAFKNGWRLFSANWLISMEMAVIAFVINILVGLAVIVVAGVLIAPIFLVAIVYTPNNLPLFSTLIYLGVSILLLVSAFVGSVLAVFQTSLWTILYLKINGPDKIYSKLVRLAVAGLVKWKKRSA